MDCRACGLRCSLVACCLPALGQQHGPRRPATPAPRSARLLQRRFPGACERLRAIPAHRLRALHDRAARGAGPIREARAPLRARVRRRTGRHRDAARDAGVRVRLDGAASVRRRRPLVGATSRDLRSRATSTRFSAASSASAGEFLFICVAIGIVMGLAGLMRRNWWVVGAPVFVVLALAFAFVQPVFITGLNSLRNPKVAADARAARPRARGSPQVPVKVEEVDETTGAERGGGRDRVVPPRLPLGHAARRPLQPCAGAGVVAHELGHQYATTSGRGSGWFGVAMSRRPSDRALNATARRHVRGRRRYRSRSSCRFAVQIAYARSERGPHDTYEAEADWVALQTTRDPRRPR